MNRTDALALLCLPEPVTAEDIRTAFRRKVKQAASGEDRLRQLILARDFLIKGMKSDRQPLHIIEDHILTISLSQAIHGGGDLPAGLRDGERLHGFTIRIQTEDGVSVSGSDIWMTAQVPARCLHLGGRAGIDTPHGPRMVPVERQTLPGSCLRLKGLGLPATERHKAGDLHVRLETAPARAAVKLLRDFQKQWNREPRPCALHLLSN